MVTINGIIKNQASDSILIAFNNSRLVFDPVEYRTRLEDGRFTYTFKVKERYTPVLISHGKYTTELQVQAGDDLNMNAVVRDSAWSIVYNGKGSEKANFTAKHAAVFGLTDQYPSKIQPYLNSAPDTFVKKMREEEQKELAFLDENKDGLSVEFVRYFRSIIQYFTYYSLFQYTLMHEVAKHKGYNFSVIPKKNYDAIKHVPAVFDDEFIGMVPYRLYADQIYRIQLERVDFFNDSAHIFRVQDSIVRLAVKNMPAATAEYVVALHLYASLRNLPVDTAADRIGKFKKRWPDSPYKNDLDAQFAIAKRLAPGQKAYDFTFTTPQGKTGRLSDFKGKAVLLGFWSTEYKQALSEMRAAAQMAKKYKDAGLVFVYVSLDSDEASWIKAIEQYKLPGIHTREEGSWRSLLAQVYGIQAIPTFFLIDKEGKFVMKNTPYPSQSANMIKAVEEVLK